MNGVRQELEKRYSDLFTDYNLERPLDGRNISRIIKQSLQDFLKDVKKPAIYCNGGHTKMLMADCMYELKKVKHIVDNYASSDAENGFVLVKDNEIEALEIDAIVLSSYKFRKDLKQSLAVNHPNIPVLDIYDEFERMGVTVQSDYYYSNHPYQHYKSINRLQREIRENSDKNTLSGLYTALVTKYIHIKDFRTAMIKLKEWENIGGLDERDRNMIEQLLSDINALYELQKKAAASLSENHVLMLCLDGLRRQDLSEQAMPKTEKLLSETGYRYTNAYSFSTSTFESLIPVYSENCDFRTRYYENSRVDSKNCRFASLAEEQNRTFYIYGDAEHYIEGDNIFYSESFLTITQKLWQFILDACETENGLFYLHELYESHFTFSNPYTEEPLMSEGTAMLFDFLPVKGGHLRGDYARQHEDALRYLDDVIEPLLSVMKCRMLIYADHGNLILDYDTKLSEIGDAEYTCSEGWTRIPMILCSPEMGVGSDNRLLSLMELNNMVISLLTQSPYRMPETDYIKIARSELYNPDFRRLYDMIGKARSLQAFECFVFTDGIKMIIYADGSIEIYNTKDRSVFNVDRKTLIERIQKQITVCDYSMLQV